MHDIYRIIDTDGLFVTPDGRRISLGLPDAAPRTSATDAPGRDGMTQLNRLRLRVEASAGFLNSLAIRAEQDSALMGQFETQSEAHALMQEQYRAELERVTGIRATLIERSLAL